MSIVPNEPEPSPPGQAARALSPRLAERAQRLCGLARSLVSVGFDVPLAEMQRPQRSRAPSCEARHAAMYLAHVAFRIPLSQIALEFGRDRSSVGHAIRRIEDRRDDRGFDTKIERIEGAARDCLDLLGSRDPS